MNLKEQKEAEKKIALLKVEKSAIMIPVLDKEKKTEYQKLLAEGFTRTEYQKLLAEGFTRIEAGFFLRKYKTVIIPLKGTIDFIHLRKIFINNTIKSQ